MAVSNPPKEYTIFINRFAELVDTLNPQHVLQYLISESSISMDDSQHILTGVTMRDKATKLLEYLAGPIKAGHVRGLSVLLEAMEEHGVGAEKELAMIIRSDFIKCENPPIPDTAGYPPAIDLSSSRKENFMKLLVGLSGYLDEVEDSFVKRFKLSLKFYSVTDRGVKVVKEVYESTDNIPDILENLMNHEYITVDNVDLLETVIKSCMADDKRYVQLYQLTSSVVEEYKKSIVLCDAQSSIERISIASLPVNLQYIIVGTSYPAVTLRHKDVEEVSDAVSSALSLPKLYFHFYGFEGDLVTLCWVLHETNCLKGYQLEVPDYDHYHWLKHLGVVSITIMNDSKCQVVDLRLVNYTGCLLLPKNRDTTEWVAKFFCVPVGYENIMKDLMHESCHLDHEMVTVPIGFQSFVSGDDHRLSMRLLAEDLSRCGWTVNSFNKQFAIDKYVVDGVVAMDMLELLPHIPIEVRATGTHHSVRFPGCKVEIEGSCYNQSFMLPSTPALEETEAEVQAELLSTSNTITDYLWTSSNSVYTQYPVEDRQQQATPVGWHFVKEDHHCSDDRGVY